MSVYVQTALQETIQVLKAAPEQAKTTFEAKATLGKHVQVTATTRGFTIPFDEPAALGGDDTAANPVESILASLGACQAIVYRALASLNGLDIEKVEVTTKGKLNLQGFLGLDRSVRPGFEAIEFSTRLVSNEPEEKLYRLSQQVDQLCPVLDILTQPVPVKGSITIEKSSPTLSV